MLTITGLLRFPARARAHAAHPTTEWRGGGVADAFPGRQAALPPGHIRDVAVCAGAAVRRWFGADIRSYGASQSGTCPWRPHAPLESDDRVVHLPVQQGFLALLKTRETAPADDRATLSLGQLSHHDAAGFPARSVAAVHALFPTEGCCEQSADGFAVWPTGLLGTGFYRDRATRLHVATRGAMEAALHRAGYEKLRHVWASIRAGRSEFRPTAGDSEYEELVHATTLEHNAITLYSGHLLHSAHVNSTVQSLLTDDPRSGRLTANLFFAEQTNPTSQRSYDEFLARGNLDCERGRCTSATGGTAPVVVRL